MNIGEVEGASIQSTFIQVNIYQHNMKQNEKRYHSICFFQFWAGNLAMASKSVSALLAERLLFFG